MFIVVVTDDDCFGACSGAEDESEFDYVKESERGPEHWGELKKEWALCKHGKLQSPIDLLNQRVQVIPKMGDIKTNYRPANATIKNRGHDIAVRNHNITRLP